MSPDALLSRHCNHPVTPPAIICAAPLTDPLGQWQYAQDVWGSRAEMRRFRLRPVPMPAGILEQSPRIQLRGAARMTPARAIGNLTVRPGELSTVAT